MSFNPVRWTFLNTQTTLGKRLLRPHVGYLKPTEIDHDLVDKNPANPPLPWPFETAGAWQNPAGVGSVGRASLQGGAGLAQNARRPVSTSMIAPVFNGILLGQHNPR